MKNYLWLKWHEAMIIKSLPFYFALKGGEPMSDDWYRRMENQIIGSIDNEIKKQKRLEEQQKKRRGGDM